MMTSRPQNLRPLTLDQSLVGACLLNFWEVWDSIGATKSVTDLLRFGYKIPFLYPPVLSMCPIRFPSYLNNSDKYLVLKESVQDMIQKGAIEPAEPRSAGFYSRLFVVPKKSGKWRPVVDLSALNKSIKKTKFKMETTRTVLSSIQANQWFTSIDLTDAYFHIPIHTSSRHYLRFVFEERVFQFRALCFGISTAPQIFTEVMKTIGAYAHRRSIRLHQYIDDWLCVADTEIQAREDTQWLLEMATKLGLRVNLNKSELTPSQHIVFLGVLIDTVKMRAYPSDQRLNNFFNRMKPFLKDQERPMWEWLSLLGHMASLEKLVFHARARMRTLQFHLKLYWTEPIQKHRMIPVSSICRLTLAWWNDRDRLSAGVSLETSVPDFFLYSDAPMAGWGATVDHVKTHGLWTLIETESHINVLELEAVVRGLHEFKQYLAHANVCVMSDNTTVVSHLSHQGGTHSETLCFMTVDLIQWTEQQDINLMSRFVPGHLNVTADMLSRKRQILNKVQRDRTEMILIAPCWPNQEWFPDLLALLIEHPRELPLWDRLLRPHMKMFHLKPQVLALHAWRLSASHSKIRAFRSSLPTSSLEVTELALRHYTKPSGKSSWIGVVGGKLIMSMPLFAP